MAIPLSGEERECVYTYMGLSAREAELIRFDNRRYIESVWMRHGASSCTHIVTYRYASAYENTTLG